MKINLNEMEVITEDGFESVPDNSTKTKNTEVFFRNIEGNLINKIKNHDICLGCIAWLTSPLVLSALSETETQIVVQKEDFLRPDIGAHHKTWPKWLREKYDDLSNLLERHEFPYLGLFSVGSDPGIEGVRCVGNHNKDKNPAFPRMHNKFMVFAERQKKFVNDPPYEGYWHDFVVPCAVWTGSFNFTKNSSNSLENALYITDPDIVKAYFSEYQQIAALSEPLDWTTPWSAPEWRIGT